MWGLSGFREFAVPLRLPVIMLALLWMKSKVSDAHLHVRNHLCRIHMLVQPFEGTTIPERRTIVALSLFAQPGEEGFAVDC